MAETEFTQADIDSLSEKISALDLTDAEKTLLSTLVALGGAIISEQLSAESFDPSEGGTGVVSYEELPDLRSGLANAFKPGIVQPRVRRSIGGMPPPPPSDGPPNPGD